MLTADVSGIADADGLAKVSYSYQWISNDGNSDTEITDATGSSYTLVAADEGKTIKVKVSFTDDAGNPEAVTSAATAEVAAKPATPARPTVDSVSHNAVTISWTDPGDPSITGYQVLRRNPAIHDSGVFEVIEDDTGNADTSYEDRTVAPETTYRYRVKARNAHGLSEWSQPAARFTTPADPTPPNTAPTGLPTIAGTPRVGETLTADTSGISDSNGLTNVQYSYQWISNDGSSDSDITNATGSTYTLVDDDEGKTIKVKVTFTDDAENDETLTSAATSSVAARPNSEATGAPTISGTAQVGETLTADTSGIADADGLTNVSYSYQWISNDGSSDTNITDATGKTHTLVDDDAGKAVKVRVSFTDDTGYAETLTSAAIDIPQATQQLTRDSAPVVDGNPSLNSSGTTVKLCFDQDLGTPGPPNSAFTVTFSHLTDAVGVMAVQTGRDDSPKCVHLYLNDVVITGTTARTLTVAYADPTTGDDDEAIQSESGTDAASISGATASVTSDAIANVTSGSFTKIYPSGNDRGALEDLYDSTDGDNWKNNARWKTNNTNNPWRGLTMFVRKVEKVQLSDNDLVGELLPSLGLLANRGELDELNLRRNSLSGPIPATLGRIRTLERLDLSENELTGKIPPSLGNIRDLHTLNLHSNSLSGPIPAELGNLREPDGHVDLYLYNNQLSGTIPAELGQSHVANLYLQFNQLTGPIPPELGNAKELFEVRLNDNDLSGPIPANLAKEAINNLRELNLQNNRDLSGTIPMRFTTHSKDEFRDLHVQNTGVTAPDDPMFQAWAETVAVTTGSIESDGTWPLDAANTGPVGLWSDGATLYVVDKGELKVFAYSLSDGTRQSAKDFSLVSWNKLPKGAWSDGTTFWVADKEDDKLYAYTLPDGTFTSSNNIDIGGNFQPVGIGSDGTHMWVSSGYVSVNSQYLPTRTYLLSDGTRVQSQEFDRIRANDETGGMWSDGEFMWVMDYADARAYSYSLSDGSHDHEHYLIFDPDNKRPGYIWANDSVRLVSDARDGKVYRYDNHAATLPAITGTRYVGETLGFDPSGITDQNGVTKAEYTYQWVRSSGGTDTDIEGATGITYELTVDDRGSRIKVRVQFYDDARFREIRTSPATAQVTDPPKPSKPENFDAVLITGRRVHLSWDKLPTATGYKIEKSDDSSTWMTLVSNHPPTTDPDADTETFVETGLPAQYTRYYRVLGYNDQGDGDWSDVDSVTTRAVSEPEGEDFDAARGGSEEQGRVIVGQYGVTGYLDGTEVHDGTFVSSGDGFKVDLEAGRRYRVDVLADGYHDVSYGGTYSAKPYLDIARLGAGSVQPEYGFLLNDHGDIVPLFPGISEPDYPHVLVNSGSGPDNGARVDLDILKTGTYIVRVGGDGATTGTYRVRAYDITSEQAHGDFGSAAFPGRLKIDDDAPMIGTISSGSDTDWYAALLEENKCYAFHARGEHSNPNHRGGTLGDPEIDVMKFFDHYEKQYYDPVTHLPLPQPNSFEYYETTSIDPDKFESITPVAELSFMVKVGEETRIFWSYYHNDNGGAGKNARLKVKVHAGGGGDYLMAVSGADGATGTYSLFVEEITCPAD